MKWILTALFLVIFLSSLRPAFAQEIPEPDFSAALALDDHEQGIPYDWRFHRTDGFFFLLDVPQIRKFRREVRNNPVKLEKIILAVNQFRNTWQRVSLNWAIYRFLGPDVKAVKRDRKIYYLSNDRRKQTYYIVDDPVGHYFRVHLSGVRNDDPEVHRYVTIGGDAFSKGSVSANSADYLRRTHFDYSYEIPEAVLEDHFDDKGNVIPENQVESINPAAVNNQVNVSELSRRSPCKDGLSKKLSRKEKKRMQTAERIAFDEAS